VRRHKVVITAAAARDLDDIFDYIADHDSIERADQIVAKLESTVTKLDLFPDRGVHPRELLAMGNRIYREAYLKPYRIVYRTSETHVNVVLIADGAGQTPAGRLTRRWPDGPGGAIGRYLT